MPTATAPKGRTVAEPADDEQQPKMTRDLALRRYPRLVAHLICESLGYFSVLSAANALAHHINGITFPCEWYSHMCSCRGKGYFDRLELLKIGADVVKAAFTQRARHKGYMAEFDNAMTLVRAELDRTGCTSGMLASWF